MGPASESKLSRRHTKQAQRQARPEEPRQPNHQPQWQEATSNQAWAEEEAKRQPHLAWDMDRLDGMTVPAFSPSQLSNNGSAINS